MSAYAKVALLAIALLLGFAGGYGWERRARIAEVATIRQQNADVLRGLADKTTAAALAAVKAKDLQQKAREVAADETAKQLARVAADRDAARASGDRLRSDLAAYLSSHRPAPNPGAVTAGDAADTPLDLLGRLFGGAQSAAGDLADYADRAAAAGAACVREFRALTP